MLTGFVNEMRMVAMKLHTREQAPKEGQQQAAPQPKAVSISKPLFALSLDQFNLCRSPPNTFFC